MLARTVLGVLLLLGPAFSVSAADHPPNVVLMMTDDQGYGDIAAHGNSVIRTPNMDALYRESIRLTNFHVDPTCSPTRGALMTGKYSHRVRVWHTVQGGNHMRSSEVTMADVFKHSGYNTAMFGKWHLGANYPYRPIDRGFEEWLGIGDGGPGTTDDYFWNDRVNDTYWHNGRREFRKGYNADVFYQAAIDYIDDYDSEHPFFVYVPTYVPHGPHTIPDRDWVQYYLDQGRTVSEAYFFASIERVDANVGRLRETLRKKRLDKNTLVIFMTDNGGTTGCNFFNAGMRGRKGQPYDGGHRVPCFFHWPAGGLDRPADVSRLTAHIDLLPTLIELCGLRLPSETSFDGRSLAALLRGDSLDWTERALCVEVQRVVEQQKGATSAAMTDRWRLVNYEELYDMQRDPGQEHDVAGQHSDIVRELQQVFTDYWAHVTPGDREHPRPIVGDRAQDETRFAASELRDASGVWNHAHVASGKRAVGSWALTLAQSADYEIEVRRWPTEVNVPIVGVPEIDKRVDAWAGNRPIEALLYGNQFTPLSVASIRLQIGTYSKTAPVRKADVSVRFRAELPAGDTDLKATMLDADGKEIGSAYYVYVRPAPSRNGSR